MFKNRKAFFINIDIYRDKSVQIRQLFAHFRPVNIWSRDQAPPNSFCIMHPQAPKLCPNFNFERHVVFEL